MLAVGEVKELIIRPDMEMVTIILHEGAVIKGRKVSSNIFHMAVADANKFEEKLREVEKRLGIKDGVPVTYDRQTDTTGRILMLLLICALLMSIATRMKSIKSPLSMDSFVSSPLMSVKFCKITHSIPFQIESNGPCQVHAGGSL